VIPVARKVWQPILTFNVQAELRRPGAGPCARRRPGASPWPRACRCRPALASGMGAITFVFATWHPNTSQTPKSVKRQLQNERHGQHLCAARPRRLQVTLSCTLVPVPRWPVRAGRNSFPFFRVRSTRGNQRLGINRCAHPTHRTRATTWRRRCYCGVPRRAKESNQDHSWG